MARLLVVVLAGAVAFAPGVTGTEAALAGPMFSHPVSTEHEKTHSVATEHGGKNSGGRGWGAHPVTSLRKTRTALKKRWQAQLRFWSQWRAERILAALDKRGPAFLVKSGWFRPTWLLVSKDEQGQVRILRKGRAGDPIGQVVAQHLSSEAAHKVLAGQLQLGPIPSISRGWSQNERFTKLIKSLSKQPDGTSVVITEKPGRGAKNSPVSWQIKKDTGQEDRVTLVPLGDHGTYFGDSDLSIPQVITRLAESFDVGSSVTVRTLTEQELAKAFTVNSRSPETSPAAVGRLAKLAADNLRPEGPSWGGEFSQKVDDKDQAVASAFNHGRGAYVEMAVPVGVSDPPALGAAPSVGNDPTRRQAQRVARYGIENLGGGELRITDVGDGGREIARGGLDDASVHAWFNEMLAHVRYAHKPGTGRDLTRLEDVFPHQPTGLTRSSTTPPYSLLAPGEMLLPADMRLTREVKLLIQDRLLQGKSIDLRELLTVVDLGKAFSTDSEKVAFEGISVRALAKEAGEITGVRVLGIARDGSGDLFTVVAVGGQLAFYDQDRKLRDHVADLLADSRVELLPTTGKETHITSSDPTRFAQLSPHTWTPVTDKGSIQLAINLGPGQTIDIIRTDRFRSWLYPEVFRINRPDNTDNYRIYKIGDKNWEERLAWNYIEMWNYLLESMSDRENVYVRPVEPNGALRIPGVKESDIPPHTSTSPPYGTRNHKMSKYADPYLYLVKAQPGSTPRTN